MCGEWQATQWQHSGRQHGLITKNKTESVRLGRGLRSPPVRPECLRALCSWLPRRCACICVLRPMAACHPADPCPRHRGVTGVHELVWALSFVSFYFLYPSTFNILEASCLR